MPNGAKPAFSNRTGKVGFWYNHWISTDIVEAQKRINSLFSKRIEKMQETLISTEREIQRRQDLSRQLGWNGNGPLMAKQRPCGCRSHFPDLVECPYCAKKWIRGRVKKAQRIPP